MNQRKQEHQRQNPSIPCFRAVLYILLMSYLPYNAWGSPDNPTTQAPQLLTFFFEPKHSSPNQLMAPAVSGIYAIYRGSVASSDSNGQVILPLSEAHNPLTVIITESITPIIIFGNTTHHLEIVDQVPSRWYQFTYEKTPQGLAWHVTTMAPPASKRIPQNALVIIAQPDKVSVDTEGNLPTPSRASQALQLPTSGNLVLPTFFVEETMNHSVNALQFLKVAKFFAPVRTSSSVAPERYATHITH